MSERLVGWKCLRPTCRNLTLRPAAPRGPEHDMPPDVCDRCKKVGAFTRVPLNVHPEDT